MCTTLFIRAYNESMTLNPQRADGRAAGIRPDRVRRRIEWLRRKLIRETEQFLNNPESPSWARAG